MIQVLFFVFWCDKHSLLLNLFKYFSPFGYRILPVCFGARSILTPVSNHFISIVKITYYCLMKRLANGSYLCWLDSTRHHVFFCMWCSLLYELHKTHEDICVTFTLAWIILTWNYSLFVKKQQSKKWNSFIILFNSTSVTWKISHQIHWIRKVYRT